MALATYSDLETAIPKWLAMSGEIALTQAVGDLISLAESRIYYGAEGAYPSPPIRVRAMETQASLILSAWQEGGTSGGSANAQTLTLGSTPTLARGLSFTFTAGFTNTGAMTFNANATGVVTVKKGSADLSAGDVVAGATYGLYYDGTNYILTPGAGYVPLPTDWLEGRSSRLIGQREYPLEQVASNTFADEYDTATPSRPTGYCIEGDLIRFGPIPDDSYIVKLNYYRKFAALSSAVNWLMTNKPDIYLYASLVEAGLFVMDDAAAQKYHALFIAAIMGLNKAEKRARFSGAPLKMTIGGYVR